MRFRNHFLLYTVLPLILIAGFASYYRFMVAGDYIVQYEGECNPSTETCFVWCEDEECTDVYYYTIVENRVKDIFQRCGPDITDCEAASVCLPSDTACTITYCDPENLGEGETCELIGDSGEEVKSEPSSNSTESSESL